MTTELALLTRRLPVFGAAGTTAPTAGQVARPVDVVEADLPLANLERAFRSADLACVAVHSRSADQIGLVTRLRFHGALSGRLGFGRALLARGTTADLTDWNPLVVDPDDGVLEVSSAAMARPEDHRYDPVLVRAEMWQAATAADLVVSLSTQLAMRTLHDPLTALGHRPLLLQQLRDRCAALRGSPHRVAVVQVDVVGFGALDAALGHHGGDAILAAVASHVRRAVPASWDVGRTGADEFTAVGTVLGPVSDADAAAAVEPTRSALVGELPLPPLGVPGDRPVVLRAGAVFSMAGGGNGDKLFRAVAAQVRRLRELQPSRRTIATS